MDWRWLYTSFHGRITRKQFWIGGVPLVLISVLISLALAAALGVNPFANPTTILGAGQSADAALVHAAMIAWVRLSVFALAVVPTAALMVKRRHDRNRSGLDVWIYLGLSALLTFAGILGLDTVVVSTGAVQVVAHDFWFSLIEGAVGLFGLYLFVVLGLLGSIDAETA